MEFSDIQLNSVQVKKFASDIFDDILPYIEAHSKEYELFLQDEYKEVETKSS